MFEGKKKWIAGAAAALGLGVGLEAGLQQKKEAPQKVADESAEVDRRPRDMSDTDAIAEARRLRDEERAYEKDQEQSAKVKAWAEALFGQTPIAEERVKGVNQIFKALQDNTPGASCDLQEPTVPGRQDIFITMADGDTVRVAIYRNGKAVVRPVTELDKLEIFDTADATTIANMVKNKFLLRKKSYELAHKYGEFYGNKDARKEYEEYIRSLGMEVLEE